MIRHASRAMHLTHDEPLEVWRLGLRVRVRLRIWRLRGQTPVVLVTRLEGEECPADHVGRLANLIFQAYLGCTEDLMYYFDEGPDGRPRAVDFRLIGHRNDRVLLDEPQPQRSSPDAIEQLVGYPVAG